MEEDLTAKLLNGTDLGVHAKLVNDIVRFEYGFMTLDSFTQESTTWTGKSSLFSSAGRFGDRYLENED